MKIFKISMAVLVCLLVCAAPKSAYTEALPESTFLKVLDINVWSGLDYTGYLTMGAYEDKTVREKRYQALVQQIKALDPDLIGVHEANKLPRYAKRLAADLGCRAFYHVGVGGVRLGPVGLPWNLREGDAILAKPGLNPEWVGRRQLSGGYVGRWATFHFEDATQVIGIRLTLNGQAIHVYATHWHASLTDAPAIIANDNAHGSCAMVVTDARLI